MTVALVLSGERRAGQELSYTEHASRRDAFGEQLAALGVSRVDAAEHGAQAMLTVAAAARTAGDGVLICADPPSGAELARLLQTGGTAAIAGHGPRAALLVKPDDLEELAEAAEEAAVGFRKSADPVGALLGELARRGVTVRILDGAAESVTDPAAADIAGWAAQRELTPMALYGMSLSIGLLSALWFSELALRAKAFAVILLFAAFVVGRAGHLLDLTIRAKGRQRSPSAGWARLATAVIAEFALYAGIAASATVPGDGGQGLSGFFGDSVSSINTVGGPGTEGVWRLAVIAMLFLAVRQMADRCASIAGVTRGETGFTRLIMAPAGQRLTVLAASVILVGARFAFLVLLGWGALAFGYLLTKLFSTVTTDTAAGQEIAACRGDGALSLALGRLAAGRIPPLLPLVVGLLVTCMLTVLGVGNLPGILVLAPVVAMLLAGLGSRSPHDGIADWIVPAAIQAGEYVYLAALAFAHDVRPVVMFALLMAVVLRHFELACRARIWPGTVSEDDAGFGWEGRMIIVGIAAFFGITAIVMVALAVWVWLVLARDFLTGWLPSSYRPLSPEERRIVRSTSRRRPAA
jgi:Family of unknown function (DUF5941)